MSEHDKELNETSEPAPQESNPFVTHSVAPAQKSGPSPIVWAGVGFLMLLALAVVFVLPGVVERYELPLEPAAEQIVQAPSQPTQPAETISPFEEAQRARLRKEAQDILAELLEVQNELDELEVEQWGQVAYENALEQASIGDEYYRTQDFALAKQSYETGLQRLQDLLGTREQVFAQLMIDAEQAMLESDSVTATDRYGLALLLNPESEEAQLGLQRATNLDEVLALVDEAEDALEDGNLEEARALYQRVFNMDPLREDAARKIDEIARLQIENEFARIMSAGYALLEQNQPDQAIEEFQRAMNLGVNNDQAMAAIVQAENQKDSVAINAHREDIIAAESEERWADAVVSYDEVLAIDSNLTFAIQGRDYADKRARLNSLLEQGINNPERFADDDVFEQTLDVYYTGRNIENPGPVLSAQLDTLQQFLEQSRVPIDIRLQSDNLTEVSVLRVGELGRFENNMLSLKPGRYVAIGRRAGYREVRQEFTVGFGQTPEVVNVRCTEQVIVSGRR